MGGLVIKNVSEQWYGLVSKQTSKLGLGPESNENQMVTKKKAQEMENERVRDGGSYFFGGFGSGEGVKRLEWHQRTWKGGADQ